MPQQKKKGKRSSKIHSVPPPARCASPPTRRL